MHFSGPALEQDHLVQALTRLLRPLVHLLQAQGFTYTRLIQILRSLYVEIAETDYQNNEGKRLTDSRVSLMTGIARCYVKELRNGETPARLGMFKSPPNTRIIAEWMTNQRFLPVKLQPLTQPRSPKDVRQPGFEELAKSITNDIKPRTLLDDLVQKGLVQIEASDCIHLRTDAYKSDSNHNDLLNYFGVHMHDHMSAAINNLQSALPPMFERSAFMSNLTESSIEKLKFRSHHEEMNALKPVYAYAAKLYQEDKKKANATKRFRMGIYGDYEDEE